MSIIFVSSWFYAVGTVSFDACQMPWVSPSICVFDRSLFSRFHNGRRLNRAIAGQLHRPRPELVTWGLTYWGLYGPIQSGSSFASKNR